MRETWKEEEWMGCFGEPEGAIPTERYVNGLPLEKKEAKKDVSMDKKNIERKERETDVEVVGYRSKR